MYTTKIKKALLTALELHKKQTRKGSNTPYIAHPLAVALIMARYTEDEDVICAAILHDTVEDTGYTFEQMRNDFGGGITFIVEQLTEDKSIEDYGERKRLAIEKLSDFNVALALKAADCLANMKDLRECIQEQGEEIWNSFHGTKEQLFWHYKEILTRAHPHLPSSMVMEYTSVLKDLEYTSGPAGLGFEAG